MAKKLRRNGAREITGPELKVFKRLVASGNTNLAIAEMLGRTERGVRGLREYYGLTVSDAYKRSMSRYSLEEEQIVKNKIRDWVEVERLSATQMETRLKIAHPPGLNRATISKWIKKLGPVVWKAHKANMEARRSRSTTLRHQRGQAQLKMKGQAATGCYSQPRGPRGAFVKKERQDEPARSNLS